MKKTLTKNMPSFPDEIWLEIFSFWEPWLTNKNYFLNINKELAKRFLQLKEEKKDDYINNFVKEIISFIKDYVSKLRYSNVYLNIFRL